MWYQPACLPACLLLLLLLLQAGMEGLLEIVVSVAVSPMHRVLTGAASTTLLVLAHAGLQLLRPDC